VHRAVDRHVVERGPVLGDDNRQTGPIAAHPQEDVAQPGGVDRPVHGRRRPVGRHRHGSVRAREALLTRVRGAHHGGLVVVDAHDVDRCRDDRQVAVQDERPVRHGRRVGHQVGRVATVVQRVEEDPVGQRVDVAHRVQILRLLGGGTHAGQVEGDTDRRLTDVRPQRRGGQAVAQQQMVDRCERLTRIRLARRVLAGQVAEV
jgi:hypothetical protein